MDIGFRHGLACVVAVVGSFASFASAQTGADLLLGNFDEGTNAVARGDAYFLNKGGTDTGGAVKLDIYNAFGRAKLDLDSVVPGINRTQPRAGFEFTHIHTGSSNPGLADQYTDVSVGLGVGIAKTDRWLAGISFGVGYAAANTFGDANGYYGRADLAVGYTINEKEKIGFVLDYDGNRTFLPDVPLPGFVYSRVLSDEVTIKVGFPYTDLEYKPSEKVTINLRYVIPDGGEADVEYAITPAFRVYGGFSQQNEAFHDNRLADSSDRVLFRQSRVEVGLRGRQETFGKDLSFTVAGGYAFSTEFESGWDSRDTDHIADPSDEPYLRVAFEVKF